MRMTSDERAALERIAFAAGVTSSFLIKRALGIGARADEADVSAPMLRRVVIERKDGGGFKLVRERDENGETFHVRTLVEAFATVLAAYLPCGTPRVWPTRKAAA